MRSRIYLQFWKSGRRSLFTLQSRSISFQTNHYLPKSTANNFPSMSIISPRHNFLTTPYLSMFQRYKSTRSSTSAIEYKLTHPRKKALPLPEIYPPTLSAEEAVTNILYNTPPPPQTPPKRHILNCLVQNEPGVLSRVSGILAARGFNIDSLVVANTEVADLSRMTIVLRGQDVTIEQARRQLEDLVPVWAVLNYTATSIVERELLLVKVSIIGPEHLHEQLVGYKHQMYDDEFLPEADLETEEHPDATSVLETNTHDPINEILTPASALRLKHTHLRSLKDLANLFGGKLADVSENDVVIELCTEPFRIDTFLKLVKPFGILEAARSGPMAFPRTPIQDHTETQEEENEDVHVDATTLPPG